LLEFSRDIMQRDALLQVTRAGQFLIALYQHAAEDRPTLGLPAAKWA
jgi:hypothetical protein